MDITTNQNLFTELTEEETSELNGGRRCYVYIRKVCRRIGWYFQCYYVRVIRCF